jgi:hypothetical protein
VDGFNLIFEDEYLSAHTPIYEFKDHLDALAFAGQVNEAGYSLCIVNGRFLTTSGSQYGVVSYDKHAEVMEMLLQTKVMEYKEPAWFPLPPAVNYASACLHINAICKALDKLVNKSVLLYDKTAPEDARISTTGVWFSLVSSGDLSFTADLCEDQARLDYVKQLWEMFGVKDMKITRDKAHEYILTGQRAGLDTTFEIRCSYSPETGSLRLVDTDGGEIFEFYEFVPLGGDKYAFQTLYSRAAVKFRDGKILSFVYALNKQDKDLAYTPDSDGIYENSGNLDEAWVTQAGDENREQYITYNGSTLHIEAVSFFGDRLNADIKAEA